MNHQRRKEINELIVKIEGIKADAETLRDAEQEAFDAMPESLQDGDRGEAMAQALDNLEQAVVAIDEVFDLLLEACN